MIRRVEQQSRTDQNNMLVLQMQVEYDLMQSNQPLSKLCALFPGLFTSLHRKNFIFVTRAVCPFQPGWAQARGVTLEPGTLFNWPDSNMESPTKSTVLKSLLKGSLKRLMSLYSLCQSLCVSSQPLFPSCTMPSRAKKDEWPWRRECESQRRLPTARQPEHDSAEKQNATSR